MSDLRTELFTKVLPKMKQLTDLNNLTFDDPEQPEIPAVVEKAAKVTTIERIFNWVKDHPACSYADVVQAFKDDITPQYIASKLHAMSNRGDLHKVVSSVSGLYMYSAAIDAYRPIDRSAAVQKMKRAREALGKEEMARRIHSNRKEKQETRARAALALAPAPVAAPAVQVTPVDLNTLSIVQARKLYDELKQIFGA